MLVDGLRPLWLSGLYEIGGAPMGRLSEWVGSGQYYFDQPVGLFSAIFVLPPGSNLQELFAAEMSRFSSAAIETSSGITQSRMPKSTAWLFIQSYYAAFYAAHCILRSVGVSATNLRAKDCRQADVVANALGYSNAPLNAAQFRCEYLANGGRLVCTKAPGNGIHEQLWRIFNSFLQSASARTLQLPNLEAREAQNIFSKLDQLQYILKLRGHASGNWLSAVRNEVTYVHQHKAWFPYGRTKADCNRLFAIQREWRKAPDDIQLAPQASDLETFMLACAFLVSLSVAMIRDMAFRSPSGKSFLTSGPIKLLNQVRT
jgi:hypothetical protein